MVELKEITKENLDEVLRLRVAAGQETFVSDTAHSLAQAYVYRATAFPFAICADNVIVGFIMMGYYEAKAQYTIWKLMIDEKYQNRGYGRAAIMLAIEYLRDRFDVRDVYLGVRVNNENAKKLYKSVGFKKTGEYNEDVLEMKLELRS